MVRLVLALAVLGPLHASSASAATLFFQAVATPATAICSAPCYQVQMFYEDSTRSLSVESMQFDSTILGFAAVAVLPMYPATNSNAGGGNVTAEDSSEQLLTIPWDLTSAVARSPQGNEIALLVEAATSLLTVDSVQTLRDTTTSCTPVSVCSVQSMGLLQNRIYLGRFNVTWIAGPVAIRVDGLTGGGPGHSDPVEGIRRLNGTEFPIAGFPTFDSADPDRDGVLDSQDNCPSDHNPDQEDADFDGLGDVCDACDFSAAPEIDTDGNGIEDGCECGDQNGDGRVDMLDLIAINLAIFIPAQTSPLCDANNDGRCDVQDIVGANQKIFGRPAYCSRYPPPGP